MKRRDLIRYMVFGTIISLGVAIPAVSEVVKAKKVKRYTYKNKTIEIETSPELDKQNLVKVKIKDKEMYVAKKKTTSSKGVEKTMYTSGYFPFGDEFDSPEQFVEELIESGHCSGC